MEKVLIIGLLLITVIFLAIFVAKLKEEPAQRVLKLMKIIVTAVAASIVWLMLNS